MRTRLTRRAGLVALVVIAIDQVAKAIVVRDIAPGAQVSVFGDTLRLVHARNPGIAGGLLAGAGTATVVAVSTFALAGLAAFALTLAPRRAAWVPVGLVLGGGISNLADRLRTGAVTDWIVRGHSGPANLADYAITVGVLLLFVVALRGERKPLGAGVAA